MGTYGLRVPTSRVGYVPEAQGGVPPGPHVLYVRGTRTSHRRTVRTAYRGYRPRSQSMLRNRRDLPNDFEAKTVVAYLKQCGLPATVSTSIAGNSVEHTFEWPATLL